MTSRKRLRLKLKIVKNIIDTIVNALLHINYYGRVVKLDSNIEILRCQKPKINFISSDNHILYHLFRQDWRYYKTNIKLLN